MMKKMEITKMSAVKYLNEMLEKLVFDKGDLKRLKTSIDHVVTGQVTTKQLREQIIESRSKIIERLIEYIPFYIKQWAIGNSINEFTNNPTIDSNSELEEKLNEKDKFLEEIGLRIKKIHEKLKQKFGAIA